MNTIEKYIYHAIRHGDFTISGKSKKTNTEYDKLASCYHKIVKSGDVDQLISLFDYPHFSVQAWAAAHSLPFNEKKALEKLHSLQMLKDLTDEEFEQIAPISHRVLVGGAKHVIKEWKAGNLKFP